MAKATDGTAVTRSRMRLCNHALTVVGVFSGLVAFFLVEGGLSTVFFAIGGLCFAVGRYLTYMENAEPD